MTLTSDDAENPAASREKNWEISGVHAATLPVRPTRALITSRPDAPLTSVVAPLECPPRGLYGFPSKLPETSSYERLVELGITLNGNPGIAFPVRKRGQQLYQLRRLHLTYRGII